MEFGGEPKCDAVAICLHWQKNGGWLFNLSVKQLTCLIGLLYVCNILWAGNIIWLNDEWVWKICFVREAINSEENSRLN